MTPAARLQAAIEILDQILAGAPAEKQLTSWARRSRFAGSKDRAAVRDHVFQVLRCFRSYGVLGGSTTGRGLILGSLRAQGIDPATMFTGEGHAPQPLSAEEQNHAPVFSSEAERLDLPEWLFPALQHSLGDQAEAEAMALRSRAPVHLRVNLLRGSVAQAQKALLSEGIETECHPASATALEVVEGARKLRNSKCFEQGLVELQDAASQAVVDQLPLQNGMRVLDFCAGGGGKSLAMAAQANSRIFAHDIDPGRMKDIAERAKRAGAQISCLGSDELTRKAPFDLILCDAPCSGSGSWRRAPEGKWRLSRARLEEIKGVQSQILDQAAELTAKTGILAYATCSILAEENTDQIEAFLQRHPDWHQINCKSWRVQDGTDGFFVSVLTRNGDGC